MKATVFLCLLIAFALCELSVKPMRKNVYMRQGRGFTFPAVAKLEDNETYTVSSNNYGWLEIKDNSGLTGFVHVSEVQDSEGKMVLPASPRYTQKIFQPPVTARKVSGGSGNVDFASPSQIALINRYNRQYAAELAKQLSGSK